MFELEYIGYLVLQLHHVKTLQEWTVGRDVTKGLYYGKLILKNSQTLTIPDHPGNPDHLDHIDNLDHQDRLDPLSTWTTLTTRV